MTRPLRRLPAAPVQIALAALAGLALRLCLVLRFPANSGDTGIYEELASNWLRAHVYGLDFGSGIVPSDMRSPGYPAFVALLYLVFRRGQAVISLAQAVIDLVTCFLVAWLASLLAGEPQRRRVWLAGLWLAATCPFVANYAAVPLTEVLATFLAAAALLLLAVACAGLDLRGATPADNRESLLWLLGGLLVGLGTLVRPETPLLLVALALVLAVRWRRPADWGKLLRAGALTAAGLSLPLLPWAARNWADFHEVQFLAPRYAASPDEYTPRGLYAWTGTWLVRFRDVYLVPWNIGSDRVNIGDIPAVAFDSADERARVAALLDRYNATLRMTPDVDAGFARLARERTARHPLRTYLTVPAGRILTFWFTPRTELLPISGHLWPIGQRWDDDPVDFAVTALFGALNIFYIALAIVGVRKFLRDGGSAPQRGWTTPLVLLIVFIAARSAFLTHIETPEPRYVLECFPAVLALGALAWLPQGASDPRAAPDGS